MALHTQIIKISPHLIEDKKIELIVRVLREEGIMAYPTDTFYGLGANCYLERAIEKVYRLKRREKAKPISLVISDRSMVNEVCVDIPPLFKTLTKAFWPGPLTLVLKASATLPKILQSEQGSIGVRLPDLSWLRRVIRQSGFPLTATSANISGEKEISKPERVIEIFEGKVDLIIDGGKTPGRLPSTVVDLTLARPKILREGALSSSKFSEYF